MRELAGLVFGVVLGIMLGAVIEGKAIYTAQETIQKKCLWPVSDDTFIAEPYSKTCFSIEGDVKKPVDCNTVLTIRQFQIVKHCF